MAHIPPDAISCSFDGDTPKLYKKKHCYTVITNNNNNNNITILKIIKILYTTFWNNFHAAVRNSLRRDNRLLPLLIVYITEKKIPMIFSGP